MFPVVVNRHVFAFSVVVLLGLLRMTRGISCVPGPFNRPICAQGEVIVEVHPSLPSAASMASRSLNGTVVQVADGHHLIRAANGSTTKYLIDSLQVSEGINNVYPNMAYDVGGSALPYPNDPLFNRQWNLAIIKALEAWAIFNGSNTVRVGIIDVGFDVTHPDLEAHVDSVLRFNGVDGSKNLTDEIGHGTHVAGTIGAVTNNTVGIAGVEPRVTLVACKAARPDGFIYDDAVMRCIDFMIKSNVKVLSNSWGGDLFDLLLWNAIKKLDAAGVLAVWAAGNDGNSLDDDVFQVTPTSYPHSNLLTVAASQSDDTLASFSNYGHASVDVAAPGVNITSTVPSATYALDTGTSMACPHVAGLAALVHGYQPALCGRRIKQVIMGAVDHLPGMTGRLVSGGRVNMQKALTAAKTKLPVHATGGPATIAAALGDIKVARLVAMQ